MAVARNDVRLANPLGTLKNDSALVDHLRDLCNREQVTQLVIGLPRNLTGQPTRQTEEAQHFGERVAHELGLPLAWQDEAATSIQAEAELRSRGRPYAREEIDALAATYILEDYLHENV